MKGCISPTALLFGAPPLKHWMTYPHLVVTHRTKDGEGYLKQPKQNHETQLGIVRTRTKNINLPNTDKKCKSTSLDNQINLRD